MNFTNYVRKPFVVEAVEVTTENIEEIAKLTGTIEYKNGAPYILVNRKLVPNVYRVHPGFWMTKFGDQIHCYSKKIFEEQFCENTPEVEESVNLIRGNGQTNDSQSEVVNG